MFKLCFVLCSISLAFANLPDLSLFDKFQQHDYKLKFERVDVVSYNKSIANRFQITTFKYNRTCPAINATFQFNVDVDSNFEMIVQGNKFLSNEYRYFPLRFQVNLCFALSKNLGGLERFYDCGNFTGCPTKKGNITHICNWTPDESKMPPFIPTGRYMIEIQILYRSTEVAIVKAYAETYRPIAIPN